MIRTRYIAAVIVLVWFSLGRGVSAQPYDTGSVHAGVALGAGLPRVPFSVYYPPVSVCGTVWGSVSLSKKFSLRAGVLAVHTFSLGTITVDGENPDLQLDITGGGLSLMYTLERSLFGRQFLRAGFGRYNVTQDIDNTAYSRSVPGISIGLSRWMFREKFSTSIDFSWLLLLNPKPRPQVLLITLGMIL